MKKVLTRYRNHTVIEKLPVDVEEDLGRAVLENMGAPRLSEFVRRDLVEAKDRGVACETAGGMWAVAARYERNFEMKRLKTY